MSFRRLFFGCYLWLALAPITAEYIGAGLNQLVLIANHDTFPVMENSWFADQAAHRDLVQKAPDGVVMLDPIHCIMTSKTHLNFLADIFDLKDATYSLGDGFLILSDWLSSFCYAAWAVLVVRKLCSITSN